MDFSFTPALELLGPNPAFRLANAARPPEDYLFAQYLPERQDLSYQVSSVNMIIRTTMAGLVGMDSPYPESGAIEISDFSEKTAKIANHVTLSEELIRKIQQMVIYMMAQGAPTVEYVANNVLNFVDKLIVQAHMDATEYLRGQALFTGAINWTFNKKQLLVNYGVPATNFLPNAAGAAAYGSPGSTFWADYRAVQRRLRYNGRAFVAHPDTVDVIIANQANGTRVLNETMTPQGMSFELGRVLGNTEQLSNDTRDRITLIAYGKEGEILDNANPGKTLRLPFCPRGRILGLAKNERSDYYVGEGATEDPQNSLAIGYTHLAPTVEGGGSPGRWAQVYTPQDMPMQLHGRGASNVLPVIEVPAKIAVMSTDMPVLN